MVRGNVHDAEKAIAIKLRDENFDRLVIEVADPDAVIATITKATSRARFRGELSNGRARSALARVCAIYGIQSIGSPVRHHRRLRRRGPRIAQR